MPNKKLQEQILVTNIGKLFMPNSLAQCGSHPFASVSKKSTI